MSVAKEAASAVKWRRTGACQTGGVARCTEEDIGGCVVVAS